MRDWTSGMNPYRPPIDERRLLDELRPIVWPCVVIAATVLAWILIFGN